MEQIEENHYKPDFEILDRYINFSSELLRLSLLAITGIGSLIMLSIGEKNDIHMMAQDQKYFFITILLFALTSGAALFHRFYASDSMSYHISYLRTKTEKQKTGRRTYLKRAEWSLITAEWLFGFSVIAFVYALAHFLKIV